MAKTNPIGVRFDKDMLLEFKEDKLAETPQGALNFLAEFYRQKTTTPPPADYIPNVEVAILKSNGTTEKIKFKKATKDSYKGKKVKVDDLTTPSKGKTKDLNEKKVTNYPINTKGGGKKESDYIASRRKLKQ